MVAMGDGEPSITSHTATSLSLLAGVRLRDAEAWNRLVRLYAPLMRYWCRRAGAPTDAIDDVVQESLAAVARGLPGFDHRGTSGGFRAWLRTIVGHKLIDSHRAKLNRPAAAGGSAARIQMEQHIDGRVEPRLDGAEQPGETGLVFRSALEIIQTEFEPVTARAFWLTAVEDRPPAAVAGELGISLNAVYKAKSRVLRRLREVLAGLED